MTAVITSSLFLTNTAIRTEAGTWCLHGKAMAAIGREGPQFLFVAQRRWAKGRSPAWSRPRRRPLSTPLMAMAVVYGLYRERKRTGPGPTRSLVGFFLHREVRGVSFLSGCSRGDRKFLHISRTQNLQPKVGENSDRRGPHGSDQIRVLGHTEGKLQSGPSRGKTAHVGKSVLFLSFYFI
jgi:hypothetical protein